MNLGQYETANIIAFCAALSTPVYYFGYFLVTKWLRKKTVIRNPDIEELAFAQGAVTADQLTSKYSGNLSATSTMAALSVAMVLLFVVALIDMELVGYQRAVAMSVCLLMTTASVVMLFAHQLYDTIMNPVFDPEKRFALRRLGSQFNVTGFLLFIVSMLLVVSMISAAVTIVSAMLSYVVMTIYIERRLVPLANKNAEMRRIVESVQTTTKEATNIADEQSPMGDAQPAAPKEQR